MHSRTPILGSLVLCAVALAWAAQGQGSHGRVPRDEDVTAQRDAGDRAHSELAALFASQDWFALRDAVERSPDSPAFYRGAVASAFNDVDAAERDFRAVIETPSDVQQAFQAHGLLAHAYMRTGRYRFTHAHLAAMQKLIPETSGLKAGVALFSALSRFQELSAKAGRPTDVQMTEDFFIPVAVNGRPAKYGFDSGLDISLISETEANRLRLPIQGVAASTFQDGASGNEVPVRFVVADRLTVGGFELRHVAFLVARKDALPFVELPPDKQGILGIPALVAFGGLRWNGERVLGIGSYGSRRGGERPNMCFHGVTPLVEGMIGAQTINMWLDTGASRTYLTQRFAQRFPKVVEHGATQTSVRLRGVGGSTEVRVTELPELTLSVGGANLLLRPAQVLPKDERVDRDWYEVWLGMDLLGQRRAVTVDFKSLRLSLE
jgi:predicted aspartyl protease